MVYLECPNIEQGEGLVKGYFYDQNARGCCSLSSSCAFATLGQAMHLACDPALPPGAVGAAGPEQR
eukprot:15470814-Alexandrium_andersonii.AAC.2